jgi:hypothetical protein
MASRRRNRAGRNSSMATSICCHVIPLNLPLSFSSRAACRTPCLLRFWRGSHPELLLDILRDGFGSIANSNICARRRR